MNCHLEGVAKYFNDHCIFSGITLNIESKNNYVILGGNGSGKSTLLKTIAGGVSASEGNISYSLNQNKIAHQELPKHITFSAPYMDVVEEFTFLELVEFQSKFKAFQNKMKPVDVLKISGLQRIQNKSIRNFSSGMKQRVKLSLAVLADAPLLLLDEPTSNLDPNGKAWYRELLANHAGDKTIIVASNFLEEEYPLNPTLIDLVKYKG